MFKNDDNDYYNDNDFEPEEESDEIEMYSETNNNDQSPDSVKLKKLMMIIIGTALLAIILIVVTIISFKHKSDSGKVNINLLTEVITLKVGESKYISYDITNSIEKIYSSYESKDNKIATVDSSGKVTGIGEGETQITIFFIEGNNHEQKKCDVIVVKK